MYVAARDERVAEDVLVAIERSSELFIAPTLELANAIVAEPGFVPPIPDGCALVVLASGVEPLQGARYALDVGAAGIVIWPQEAQVIGEEISGAVMTMRNPRGVPGKVVEVVGTHGGAGSSSLVAQLAGAFGPQSLIADVATHGIGQGMFVNESVHASGGLCVHRPGTLITGQDVAAFRSSAPVTIVDGRCPDADVSLVVCSSAVLAARGLDHLREWLADDWILIANRMSAVAARNLGKRLGAPHVFAVPDDTAMARLHARGKIATRGGAAKAIGRIAGEIFP